MIILHTIFDKRSTRTTSTWWKNSEQWDSQWKRPTSYPPLLYLMRKTMRCDVIKGAIARCLRICIRAKEVGTMTPCRKSLLIEQYKTLSRPLVIRHWGIICPPIMGGRNINSRTQHMHNNKAVRFKCKVFWKPGIFVKYYHCTKAIVNECMQCDREGLCKWIGWLCRGIIKCFALVIPGIRLLRKNGIRFASLNLCAQKHVR